MGQGEGIRQVLAPFALQDPQQQRRQVRAQPGPPAAGAQQFPQAAAHLAAPQLAAQRRVLDIEQLAARGRKEVIVADQVGNGLLPIVRDRLGSRAAQIAHDGHRRAEVGHRARDRRPHLGGILGGDLDRVQHPVAPAVQAQKQRAPALVAGGVDVQRIALRHGGAQGGDPGPVQGFEQAQEAIAQRGHGTVGQADPLPGQIGTDFAALAVAVIARQAHPGDQVIAVPLPRRHQRGQLRGHCDRRAGALRAVLANLAGLDLARDQRDHPPRLALLGLQGAVAARTAPLLGREIHRQQRRGAWPCKRRASCTGDAPGWRINARSTSLMTVGSHAAAGGGSKRAWRAQRWAAPRAGSLER